MKRLLLSLLCSSLALAGPLVTDPNSNGQIPLVDVEESVDIVYDVRKYALGSKEDAAEALRQAKLHNLDVWSLDGSSLDLHFTDDVPEYFAARNHSSLSTSYTVSKTRKKHKGKYPGIGSWELDTVTNCTFHNAYHEYDEIMAFVQQLAEEYPKRVELVKIGRTYEDRDIIAVNIDRKKGKWRKKRVIVQGAQHAREWVATSTALYFAHSLLASKHDPNTHRDLLNHMDFTIIPLPNPDGYAYTWDTDRLWYKNRQKLRHKGAKCKGLDLGRNWDYEWEPSSDSDPCSHWYPGSKPFEALETRAISAFIRRTPNIRGFLDLRSYGQIIMHPFSHSCAVHPHDEENLMEAALGAAQAIERTHGTLFKTGSLCEKLYDAPGNIVDWMYGTAGIKVPYSVLLRDTGTHGFLLPPHSVRPVGEETSNMIKYLVHWIRVRHP